MSDHHPISENAYKQVLAAAEQFASLANGVPPQFDFPKIAETLRHSNKPDWGYTILAPLKNKYSGDAYFNFVLALLCRDRQDMEGACDAISVAAALAPDNPDVAFAKAQMAFETWRPAADDFQHAAQLAPDNLTIKKNLALALVAEEQAAEARRLLKRTLDSHPDWIDGHRQLTSVNVTTGYDKPFEHFQQACHRMPNNLRLRLAWFYLVAQTRNWDAAHQVLEAVPTKFRNETAYVLANIYLQAETGTTLKKEYLAADFNKAADPGLDLCLTRYYLRQGEPFKAEQVAQKHIGGANERMFWPYLSLCWRLNGDDRLKWLERDNAFISAIDLPVSKQQLSTLANILHSLQNHQKPYLEQSVRGGTQTDRNLFFNPNKDIQQIKTQFLKAIDAYINDLPKPDKDHPLLAYKPETVRFSGAWSVLLSAQGFHATHTHVSGWLSSAFYVDLPKDPGTSPAGYLSFGKAPPELGLELDTVKYVEPFPGRLVLFPSYCWHGTEPFKSGDRLTIAFDIT